MIPLSSLRHRDVLDTSSATIVGRVEGMVVDAPGHRIAAFVVGHTSDGDRLLPWSAVKSVGEDAITVEGDGALREPADDDERRAVSGELTFIGKRVLTEDGDEIGTVHEVAFDEQQGTLGALDLGERTVPAESLVGVGDFAVVVTTPV